MFERLLTNLSIDTKYYRCARGLAHCKLTRSCDGVVR